MKGDTADTEETLDKVSDSETAPFKATSELHAKFNNLESLHSDVNGKGSASKIGGGAVHWQHRTRPPERETQGNSTQHGNSTGCTCSDSDNAAESQGSGASQRSRYSRGPTLRCRPTGSRWTKANRYAGWIGQADWNGQPHSTFLAAISMGRSASFVCSKRPVHLSIH